MPAANTTSHVALPPMLWPTFVPPPCTRLRGLIDDFHFNRLAMVGEGANLRLPGREAAAARRCAGKPAG